MTILRCIGALAALAALFATLPAAADDLSTHCIGCNMRGTDLRDVKFVGVDLTGAHLDGADLRGASFTGVDFGDATLSGARVRGVRITGAELKRIQLAGVDTATFFARCIGCDFSHADMHGVDMHGTELPGADFRTVRWCEHLDRTCHPATADELRRYGRNAFTGAQMP